MTPPIFSIAHACIRVQNYTFLFYCANNFRYFVLFGGKTKKLSHKNLVFSKIVCTFAPAIKKYSGVEQLVARQAHNLEVACSSPASATNEIATF